MENKNKIEKWQQIKYDIHDRIMDLEKAKGINGIREHWFWAGLVSGLGISVGLMTKYRGLGLLIGGISILRHTINLEIMRDVMNSDMKGYKEYLNQLFAKGVKFQEIIPGTVDPVPKKENLN